MDTKDTAQLMETVLLTIPTPENKEEMKDIIQTTRAWNLDGNEEILKLHKDGTIITSIPTVRKWTDIVCLQSDMCHVFGVKNNGKILMFTTCDNKPRGNTLMKQHFLDEISRWQGVKQLIVNGRYDSTGKSYGTMTLFNNGTVRFIGDELYDGESANTWENIVQLYFPSRVSFDFGGLKSDGTFVGTKSMADLSRYSDIQRIEELNGVLHFYLRDNKVIRYYCHIDVFDNVKKLVDSVCGCYHVYLTTEGKIVSDCRDDKKLLQGQLKNPVDIVGFPSDPSGKNNSVAILLKDGRVRIYHEGYDWGQVICDNAKEIRLIEDKLIAYVSQKKSSPSRIKINMMQDLEEMADCNCIVLGDTPIYEKRISEIAKITKEWKEAGPPVYPDKKIKQVCRDSSNKLYFLFEDGTVSRKVPYTDVVNPWEPLLGNNWHALTSTTNICVDISEYRYPESDWTGVVELQAHRYLIGIKSDGTVVSSSEYYDAELFDLSGWHDIVMVKQDSTLAVGLQKDGHVVCSDENINETVSLWSNIVEIACSRKHVVAIDIDGKVFATGNNDFGQCEVAGWSDICQISCGTNCTIGLQRNGFAVAAGENKYGRCDISSWTDIKQILCYGISSYPFNLFLTIGLRNDGSTISTGLWTSHCSLTGPDCEKFNSFNHTEWCDLKKIWTEGYYLIGERVDGHRLYVHRPETIINGSSDSPPQMYIEDWSDIKKVMYSSNKLVAFRENGTLAFEKDKYSGQATTWRNIKDVICCSCEGDTIIALLTNNKLVSDQSITNSFVSKFSDVKSMLICGNNLYVLAGDLLSVSFPTMKGERFNKTLTYEEITLPNVKEIFYVDNGFSVCIVMQDDNYLICGATNFDSSILGHIKSCIQMEDNKMSMNYLDCFIGITTDNKPFLITQPKVTVSKQDRYEYKITVDSYDILNLRNINAVCDYQTTELNAYFLTDKSSVHVLPRDLYEDYEPGDILTSNDLKSWVDMKWINAAGTHIIGLTNSNRLLSAGDSLYGSGDVDDVKNPYKALVFRYCTLLLTLDAKLRILCTKKTAIPFDPLPVKTGVKDIAVTHTDFVILTSDGVLWGCKKNLKWNFYSEINPWGTWKELYNNVVAIEAVDNTIKVFQRK